MANLKDSTSESSKSNPLLPQHFCWTRMGAESGQPLEAILARKELERAASDGTFYWGFGNALGDGPQVLAVRERHPRVLFSKIRGPATSRDSQVSRVVMWLSSMSPIGQSLSLPPYVLVTSRANTPSGSLKRTHFALLCRSNRNLCPDPRSELEFCALRNLTTGHPLGYSQVTAVVEMPQQNVAHQSQTYPVELIVEWQRPFVARLTEPVVLDQEELKEIDSAGASGSVDHWRRTIRAIKEAARSRLQQRARQSLDIVQLQLQI